MNTLNRHHRAVRTPLLLALGVLWLMLPFISAVAGESTPLNQPRANLFTGGQPSSTQLGDLAQRGVRLVIDLRGMDEARGFDEASRVRELDMAYVHLPISGAADLTAENAAALKQALDSADGTVLLHCASGNRVGALLALMAARNEHLDSEAALELGRAAGMSSLEPIVRQQLAEP